jgi:hypothetical protein
MACGRKRSPKGPLFRTFSMRGDLQANRIDGRDVARLVQRLTGRAQLEGI